MKVQHHSGTIKVVIAERPQRQIINHLVATITGIRLPITLVSFPAKMSLLGPFAAHKDTSGFCDKNDNYRAREIVNPNERS